MKPDLTVEMAGVSFASPIMTASGCCGYGEELAKLYPLRKLGALVTKSITLAPRMGHPPPRTAEASSGMLNAIGLANVGIDSFVSEKVPFLEKQDTKVIVNVAGSTLDEYIEVSRRLNDQPAIDMLELNISCPNVAEGGIEFGTDPSQTEKAVAAVRKVFSRPMIAKLTPNVTDITQIAKAAENGGADILSVANSLIGMSVDPETWQTRLTNNRGGMTGPAIKPIILALVDRVYNACKLPIIGVGGVASADDVVEYMLCGATAVQIGTALFVDPDLPVTIAGDLINYLKGRKLATITELIGKVRKY